MIKILSSVFIVDWRCVLFQDQSVERNGYNFNRESNVYTVKYNVHALHTNGEKSSE